MKKVKQVAVITAIVAMCFNVGYVAGQRTKEAQIQRVAQAVRERRQQEREEKEGYILIHTTDGEAWGFYGDMKVISDGTDGSGIDIDMSGWLVGSTHDCYSTDPEE